MIRPAAHLDGSTQRYFTMFKSPDRRVSASNTAVLSSVRFVIPVSIHASARSSDDSLGALRQAFLDVEGFVANLAGSLEGATILAFDDSLSSRMAHYSSTLHGKDYHHQLAFGIRCPIASDLDFWGRITLVSSIYDRLSELGSTFRDRKGVELVLDQARLEADGGTVSDPEDA